MANRQIAEHVLRIFRGREQASEIIGDLLEQQAGAWEIWCAVFALLWAAIWRWLFAFVAAMLSMMTILHRYEIFQGTSAHQVITSVAGINWLIAGLCAWSVLVLNAVRFGWKDRLNVVSFAVATLLGAVACSTGTAYQPCVLVAASLTMAACLLSKPLRPFTACLLVSAGCYAGIFLALVHLIGGSAGRSSSFAAAVFFSTWLLSFVAQGIALARMRSLLLERVSRS